MSDTTLTSWASFQYSLECASTSSTRKRDSALIPSNIWEGEFCDLAGQCPPQLCVWRRSFGKCVTSKRWRLVGGK